MAAALHLMGGHWLALQSVAWVTMLVDYAEDASMVEALSKTFDGQHPCSMCRAVASGQSEENDRRESSLDAGVKLVAVLAEESPASALPSSELRYFPYVKSPPCPELAMISPPPWRV